MELVFGVILTIVGLIAFVIFSPVIASMVLAALFAAFGYIVGAGIGVLLEPHNLEFQYLLGGIGAGIFTIFFYAVWGVRLVRNIYSNILSQ